MEKILIKKNILTYRDNDYEIVSHEVIDNKFVHINTENMTIALVPGDTEINGVLANTIEDIDNALKEI
jgi:hypothetical protein